LGDFGSLLGSLWKNWSLFGVASLRCCKIVGVVEDLKWLSLEKKRGKV